MEHQDTKGMARPLVWALLILVIAGWLGRHPYHGVAHDGLLYAFQSMKHMHPEFLDDLFLKYGSQDAYTVFNPAYGAVIGMFGLEHASMLFVGSGMALWLIGAGLVSRALFPAVWPFVLVVVAAANPIYGLDYGEGFATPRLFVEAMSLIAIWLLLGGAIWRAIAVCLVSALLHPIVGLGTLGVGVIYLSLANVRWLLLPVLGCIGAALLGWVGVAPFSDLYQQFDAEWLTILEARNPLIFASGTEMAARYSLAIDAMVIIAVLAVGPQSIRRFMVTVIMAMAVVIALKWVTADWMHNVFLTQLQPARTLWLTHSVAMMALGWLLIDAEWRQRNGPVSGALIVISTLLSVAAASFSDLALFHAMLAAAVLMCFALSGTSQNVVLRTFRMLLVLAAMTAAGLALFLSSAVATSLLQFDGIVGKDGPVSHFAGLVLPAFVLVLAWALVAARRFRGISLLGGALAFVALALGAFDFDRRTAWAKQAERAEGRLPGFPVEIGETESVFWQGSWYYSEPWIALRRKTYISVPQGAGLVFSRATAMAFVERVELMQRLDPLLTRAPDDLRPTIRPAPTIVDVLAVCAADDRPDVMVLSQSIDGLQAVIWNSPVPAFRRYQVEKPDKPAVLSDYGIEPTTRHYIYRCDQIGEAG